MGDAAEKLVQFATLLLAQAPGPEWLPLPVEAQRRSMSTTNLRNWCLRHKVEIREVSHRDAWVRPASIDEAVRRMDLALPAPSKRTQGEQRDELDEAIDAQAQRRAKRSG